MYCIITTCSVECYWHCSDGTVHYKSDKTVNFCGFRCTKPFLKRCFLHLYLLFFISSYAEIKCLQHSINYYGRVTVSLILFINVTVTALFWFTKWLDYTIHSLTRLPVTWFYILIRLDCPSLGITLLFNTWHQWRNY